jgi:phage/plasmid-like protein (TIGR03299 family)
MPHNLATREDGGAAMVYVGDTPWHRLGEPIDLTIARNRKEVQQRAGIDFTVALHPLYLADGTEVPDRKAILRDDDGRYISTVGRDYQVRQYDDAFSILDDAIRDSGVWIETAGLLGRGEQAWMLARMDAAIDVKAKGGYDRVTGRFLVGSSHNGSQAHYGKLTPERVVCQNTLTAALEDGLEFIINIPHTRGQDEQLGQARELVTKMAAALKQTGQTFDTLAKAEWTKDKIVAYIESVFPTPVDEPEPTKQLVEKREQVIELVSTSPGHELAGSTAWGAYNAVTYFVDHARIENAKSDAGRQGAARAALFGTGALLKARALQLARQLVAA